MSNTKHEADDFTSDKILMHDFYILNKDNFLGAHPEVTPDEWEATKKAVTVKFNGSNTKHTPGNVLVKDQGRLPDGDGRLICIRSESSNGYIAQIQEIGEHREQAKANAKRIVRCWNNHDDLVAALEKLVSWLEYRAPGEKPGYSLDVAKEVLKKAIE